MKIRQISVFLENRPGHLSHVCRILADAGINIVTLTVADTSEFGILRLIVREWEQAKHVLEAAGFAVNLTDVAAIEVADQPGGLGAILEIADAGGLSVEYMYAFACGAKNKALLVIRFDDAERAAGVMEDAGIGILPAKEFYRSA
ncbi:MAG: ACT domain-containing protein [Kiritimatiellales bacterium]